MPWLKCPNGCLVELEDDVFQCLQVTSEIAPEKAFRCPQCHRNFRFTAFTEDISGQATETVDSAIGQARKKRHTSLHSPDHENLVKQRLSRLLAQRPGVTTRFAQAVGLSEDICSPTRLNGIYQSLVQLLINSEVTTNTPTPRLFGLMESRMLKNYWHFANPEWLSEMSEAKESRYARERDQGEKAWFSKLSSHFRTSEAPDPITRPVYLALNPGKLKQGAAPMYGQSYIVYKDTVKLRSTFTASDTLQLLKADERRQPSERVGYDESKVFVFQNLSEILLHVSDRQLRYLCSLVGGPAATNPNEFIEVQAWGKIDLTQDVEAIVLSRNDLESMCYEKSKEPNLIQPEMISLSTVERGQRICRLVSQLVRLCRQNNIKLYLLPLSGQTMNSTEARSNEGLFTCAGYWGLGMGVSPSIE